MCLIRLKSYYHSSIGFVICQRKAPYGIRSILNCVKLFNRSRQFLSVRGAKAVRVSYHVAISKSLPQLIAIAQTKRSQERPKTVLDRPRWSRKGPKWSNTGPRGGPRCAQTVQEEPRETQDGPRQAKMVQERFKMVQDRTQEEPRQAPESKYGPPRCHRGTPKSDSLVFFGGAIFGILFGPTQ
jgi:hypothetical protein